MEEFESCASKLKRLLDEMTALNGQDGPPAVTAEWMKQAQAMLSHTSTLTADPRFAALKSSPQVHQYRTELLRLKETVDLGKQQLMSQRKAIQADQSRIKRVRALTGALRSVQ